MKFDSNRAWKDASAAVSANRDLLFVLAGVFLALPSFALGIFMPPPEPPAGADPNTAFALLGQYYRGAWPALLGLALLSLLGTLTMLALFTDRTRPTVAEAIRLGARGVIPVIAAQFIVGMAGGLVVLILGGLAGASGSPGLKLLAGFILVIAFGYAVVRLSLLTPVVMVDGQRGPVRALARSWALTAGSVLHLFAFYALLLVAFLVLYLIASKAIGLVVALVASGETVATVNDLVAAVLQALFSVYAVAVVAACHRQLAGASPDVAARHFE